MTSNLNLVEYLGKNPYQILYPERFVVYVGESEDGEGIIHVYYYKPERGEPSLLDEAQIERVQQINGVYDPEIGAEALQLLEFNLLGYPNEILKKIVLDATSESRQLQLRLLNRDIQDVYDTFVRYPEVWVCGDNGFGQLGLGDTQNRNLLTQLKSIPYKAKVVRFGRYHMAVVTVNGQVWTSGLNQYGQLGLGDTQNRSTPARVPFPRDFAFEDGDDYIVDAFCGRYISYALSKTGKAWAWGSNDLNLLGTGETGNRIYINHIPHYILKTPVPLIATRKIVNLSCGSTHTAFITEDRNPNQLVWTVGDGGEGQLGLGNYESQRVPNHLNFEPFSTLKLIKVTCGGAFTLVVTEDSNGDNQVWAFGQYTGTNEEDKNTPVQVIFNNDVNKRFKVVDISGGVDHAAIITSSVEDANSTELWVFGENHLNQLGVRGLERSLKPIQVQVPENSSFRYRYVSCGGLHTATVTQTLPPANSTHVGEPSVYKLWTFGFNESGQLGLDIEDETVETPTLVTIPTSYSEIISISCRGAQTAVITI